MDKLVIYWYIELGVYMSLSSQVRERVKKYRDGQVFTYSEFSDLGNFEAVANALSRLKKKGVVARLSKGKYYVPRESKFGTLGPSEWQIIDVYLKNQGGYVAGQSAFNALGLSTQIPNEIVIAGSRSSRKAKVGFLNLRFKQGPQFPTKFKDTTLIQILEALKDIRSIPDAKVNETFQILKQRVQALDRNERSRLAGIAENYRPAVRALLGAILETSDRKNAKQLMETLNPLSTYNLGLSQELLPNRQKWKIK
jgi:hypothetical protein